MKKLLYIACIISLLWSCSVDDTTNEDFYFEILPIENATVPEEMIHGEIYTIDYTYLRPSSCHLFNDLYYVSENNYRTIAVINTVVTGSETANCENLTDELIAPSFTFYCEKTSGTYIFKFWQGEDDNGEDTYLIFEVPVIN